jgi:hypothetical protein
MNKHDAIYAIHSNVVVIRGDDAFDADGNPVTYDETAVQAYIDAHSYIAKRQSEYPTIGDQLDALWKGGDAQTEMLAKVMAVKAKYPKEQA